MSLKNVIILISKVQSCGIKYLIHLKRLIILTQQRGKKNWQSMPDINFLFY